MLRAPIRHSVYRRAYLLAVTAMALMGTFCRAGIKSEKLLAAIIEHTPATTIVPAGQELRSAIKTAATIPGAEAFWGVGASMTPLFPDKTAIVVAPVKFSELKKGMTVVYLSRRGRMVAHSLTGDLPKGWIAQGVNNDREDDDLVTSGNLLGVIVRAYSEMDTDFRFTLAKQLVAHGRLAANFITSESHRTEE